MSSMNVTCFCTGECVRTGRCVAMPPQKYNPEDPFGDPPVPTTPSPRQEAEVVDFWEYRRSLTKEENVGYAIKVAGAGFLGSHGKMAVGSLRLVEFGSDEMFTYDSISAAARAVFEHDHSILRLMQEHDAKIGDLRIVEVVERWHYRVVDGLIMGHEKRVEEGSEL